MLISRYSISIPLLCTNSFFEERIKSVLLSRFFTAGRLLETLGVERVDSEPENETIYSWNDFWNDQDAVRKLQKYDNMIAQNSEKQEQNIEEYFKQIGMRRKVGIVDIG